MTFAKHSVEHLQQVGPRPRQAVDAHHDDRVATAQAPEEVAKLGPVGSAPLAAALTGPWSRRSDGRQLRSRSCTSVETRAPRRGGHRCSRSRRRRQDGHGRSSNSNLSQVRSDGALWCEFILKAVHAGPHQPSSAPALSGNRGNVRRLKAKRPAIEGQNGGEGPAPSPFVRPMRNLTAKLRPERNLSHL